MSGLWFRIYDEALDDPRLQRLPASLFRAWFNLLCAASRNGGTLPDLPDLAFMLRTRPGALSRRLDALRAVGLVEEVDGELRPVEWEKRQFVRQDAQVGAEPMTAAERTRRWRERRARDAAGVTGDVTVTAIDLESNQETKTQTAPEGASACAGFNEFWQAFPSRDGDNPEQPALEAFRKAVAAGAEPEAIIGGAKAYASATAGSAAMSHPPRDGCPRSDGAKPGRFPPHMRRSSRRFGFPRPRRTGAHGPIIGARRRARARPSTPRAAGAFPLNIHPRRSNRRRNHQAERKQRCKIISPAAPSPLAWRWPLSPGSPVLKRPPRLLT